MDQTTAKRASEIYQEIARVKKNLRALDQIILEKTHRVFVMDGNTDACADRVLAIIKEDLSSQLPVLEQQLETL